MIDPPCRPFALLVRGACALWLAVSLVGCLEIIDHGTTPCEPSTCTGCCTAEGVCMDGASPFACGIGGGLCDRCTGNEACETGSCTSPVVPDPDGGSNETTICGPSNCAGCCSEGRCILPDDQSAQGCGTGGLSCSACDSNELCASGACVPKSGCEFTWNANTNVNGPLIDFDVYPVGGAKTWYLKVENRGPGPCEITAPTWQAGSDLNAFSFAGKSQSGFTLQPFEQATIPVTFSPYAVSSWREWENGFTFVVNDNMPPQCGKVRGCRRVGVKATSRSTGFAPVFSAAQTSVDFGTVTVGCESTWRSVQVVNAGPDEVAITGAFVSGGGFSMDPGSVPPTIAPWSHATIRVRYAPLTKGTHNGLLRIGKGTGPEDILTVPLSGKAISSSEHTFSATQALPGDIDVLFVIHHGGGMGPFQTELAQAASILTQRLSNTSGQFHAGVITSDLTHAGAGRLQGNPRWVEPGVNAGGQLANNLRVGVSSGVPDQAFEALRVALLAPNGTDPIRNGGFRRDGVPLAIIFMSNSTESSLSPTDDYVRTLLGIAGSELQTRRVKTFALASSDECQSGHYAELISRIHGDTDNCRPLVPGNVANEIADISRALLDEVQDKWVLPLPVDPSRPVSVRVDGSSVSPSPSKYSLDPATGILSFEPGYAPEQGKVLEVDYTPVCHP